MDDSYIWPRWLYEEWYNIAVLLEEGENDTKIAGTGFFIGFKKFPCLVTNLHVIDGKEIWYRINIENIFSHKVPINVENQVPYSNWFIHPSKNLDLAIAWAPIVPASKNHFAALNSSRIGFDEHIKNGANIITSGYPEIEEYSKKDLNFPTPQIGNIIKVYEDTFDIKCETHPGVSGSPVFLKTEKKENSRIIGVIKQGSFDRRFGIAVKAKYILDIINSKECQEEFKQRYEETMPN